MELSDSDSSKAPAWAFTADDTANCPVVLAFSNALTVRKGNDTYQMKPNAL